MTREQLLQIYGAANVAPPTELIGASPGMNLPNSYAESKLAQDIKMDLAEARARVISSAPQSSAASFMELQQQAQQLLVANPYAQIPTMSAPPPTPQKVEASKPAPKPKKKAKKQEKVSLESVVIADDKLEEIKAAISQVEHEDLIFGEWGFGDVFEKGTAITMLFHGVPGTGKTLMAQAIANEIGADLKIYGNAEIQSSEPGGAERAIKKLFAAAKDFFTTNKKQQVILLDECDALLYDRAKVGVILGGQINTLLTEIERHEGIIIFTTNRIGTLDPALERRIAAKIEFTFPTEEQRVAIWKRMVPKDAPLDKDVSFKKLAEHPIAGGNIKNAVLNAARMAAYKKAKSINMMHFDAAVQREVEAAEAFREKYEVSPGGYIAGNDIGITEGRGLTVERDTKMGIKPGWGKEYQDANKNR
jgi:SpoVK/Ycf46/Vps4 family AAA+-type ATPase